MNETILVVDDDPEIVGAIAITNSGDMFILNYGGNSQGYVRISYRDDFIF